MNPTDARRAPKVFLVQVPVTIPVVARTADSAKSVAWKALLAGDAWRYITRDRAPRNTHAMQVTEPTELSYNTYPRHVMPITDDACEDIVTLRQAFIEYKRYSRDIDHKKIREDQRANRRARAARRNAQE